FTGQLQRTLVAARLQQQYAFAVEPCVPQPGLGACARDRAVRLMLDQLGWWGRALREARAVRPYVS
ncbi:hypothetical protein AB0917_07510, partial [Streptomyces sp. NPDC007346]